MSTCPESDLHSIYLDNEMPLSYVAKYEEHVKNCSVCQSKLENLRKVKNLIAGDSKSICLSQKDLDQSYDRLISRLSYSRTTSPKTSKTLQLPVTLRYVLTGAAAAAVVALILPARLQTNTSTSMAQSIQSQPPVQQVSFTPVARSNPIPSKNTQNLFVDGAITTQTLSTMLGSDEMYVYNDDYEANLAYPTPIGTPEGIKTASYDTMQRSSLSSYDMFMTPPAQEHTTNNKGFVLHLYAPFATLSLEIGSGN